MCDQLSLPRRQVDDVHVVKQFLDEPNQNCTVVRGYEPLCGAALYYLAHTPWYDGTKISQIPTMKSTTQTL